MPCSRTQPHLDGSMSDRDSSETWRVWAVRDGEQNEESAQPLDTALGAGAFY